MRILVSNDDGIDAPGIIHLAGAMADLGEVVVVAPNREFSGASAAIGAIHLGAPIVERRKFEGDLEAWAVDGPPALGVFYAANGVFGAPFDLVVSGINPGANTGRAVYYSGTIGACTAGRNAGWSGVAVSQHVAFGSIEGQAYDDAILDLKFHAAAAVAKAFVAGLITNLPTEPVIANLNVPNLEIADMAGWRLTPIARNRFGPVKPGTLVPIAHRPGYFDVKLGWTHQSEPALDTDAGSIAKDIVSVSYLSPVEHQAHRDDLAAPESALSSLVSRLDRDTD